MLFVANCVNTPLCIYCFLNKEPFQLFFATRLSVVSPNHRSIFPLFSDPVELMGTAGKGCPTKISLDYRVHYAGSETVRAPL